MDKSTQNIINERAKRILIKTGHEEKKEKDIQIPGREYTKKQEHIVVQFALDQARYDLNHKQWHPGWHSEYFTTPFKEALSGELEGATPRFREIAEMFKNRTEKEMVNMCTSILEDYVKENNLEQIFTYEEHKVISYTEKEKYTKKEKEAIMQIALSHSEDIVGHWIPDMLQELSTYLDDEENCHEKYYHPKNKEQERVMRAMQALSPKCGPDDIMWPKTVWDNWKGKIIHKISDNILNDYEKKHSLEPIKQDKQQEQTKQNNRGR